MSDSPGILIIRLSSLGDILHTLPAFSGLRAAFPAAKIDWLSAKKSVSLLSAVRGIDEIHVLDTGSLQRFPPDWPAWRSTKELVRKLRARNYDYAIDFQGLLKTGFLAFLSGSRTRLGFSRDLVRERPAHWFYNRTLGKPDTQFHVLELNRKLAGLTGGHIGPTPLDFTVREEDAAQIDSLLAKEGLTDFVIINPGGGWPTKRWNLDRYGALAAKIQGKLGLRVAVTTGPGEDSYYSSIAENCSGSPLSHLPVAFLQLIPLLQKARMMIGGDTGPFHLACAVGTPAVGIFGPTSPIRNGPWNAMDEVVVHTLPCSYCYGRTCPTKNECMDIAVDEVFEAVVRRLGK
jgi:lipopolysaccharide heptosyltransferase I